MTFRTIFGAAILIGCLSSTALAQASGIAPTVTIVSTTPHEYAPMSNGAYAVREWLLDRQAEGQLPEKNKLSDGFDQAVFSVKFVTTTTTAGGPTPDLIAPDGTQLPTTGKPGQTITISDCLVHTYKYVYYYKWVPDSQGGHWVLYKTTTEDSAQVACSGAV